MPISELKNIKVLSESLTPFFVYQTLKTLSLRARNERGNRELYRAAVQVINAVAPDSQPIAMTIFLKNRCNHPQIGVIPQINPKSKFRLPK
jgi:hypothetical protein